MKWNMLHGMLADYPREKTIHQLFEEQVERTPDHIAVVFGDKHLTYADLNKQANQLAHVLRAKGLDNDEAVGIMVECSLEMIIGIFGILKAGGAYVPIDPEYPKERIRYMLTDSGANLLLTQLPIHQQTELASVVLDLLDKRNYGKETGNLTSNQGSDTLACIMYTSGSTGEPKGALTMHYNIIRVVKKTNYIQFSSKDRILQVASFSFDGSTFGIYGALLNGGTLVLNSQDQTMNARELSSVLRTQQITKCFVTTALFNALVDVDPDCFATIETLLFGGEKVSVSHVRKAFARLGPGRLIHVYGPTESTVFATYYPIDHLDENANTVPIGKPISSTKVYILDQEQHPLPQGVAGELYIAGDGLVKGYLNRPELTEERFIQSSWVPGGRLYRTGDWVQEQADGNIEYISRIDDQVKIRGFRIEPGEIESHLLKVDDIQEAAVIAREKEDGQKQLEAYFTATKKLTADEIKTALSIKLPNYMIPSFYIQLEQMPLTLNGKLDRKALLALEENIHGGAEYVSPKPGLETKLMDIWQDVLGVQQFSVLDSFFDLGGHSIHALTLMSRMERAGYHATLTDIYHYKTIRALADYLRSTQNSVIGSQKQQDIIETTQELMSWLHQETDGVYELVKYQVRDFIHEVRDIQVLYYDTAADVNHIMRIMDGKIAQELLPHYIVPLHQKAKMADLYWTMDEEEFFQRLGLKSMDLDQAASLRKRLEDDYLRKDQWIKTGQVAQEYPLSGIQQMQISFHTPPSLGIFRLDECVNYDFLDQAYALFIQSQGLLRSVPVQRDGWTYWREYALSSDGLPKLNIIDVSDYNPCGPITDMINDYVTNTRFAGEHTLFHMFVLKRNLREHYVITIYHHAICDRVTSEVAERQLIAYYRSLLQNRPLPKDEVKPYVEYVKQIQSGPKGITEQELISAFNLEAFQKSKQNVFQAPKLRTSTEAYLFNVSIPAEDPSLEFALSVYTKGLQTYLGMDKLPLLFLYDGRRYDEAAYYNTAGEFIDFVPMLMELKQNPDEMMQSVRSRLDLLKHHTINFMHLFTSPDYKDKWKRARTLAQFGKQYKQLDLFMFNYLGNSAKAGSKYSNYYDDTVIKQPNPLPIYSLFNCIASSYTDGLIFSIRCSYEIEVKEVRAAFYQAAGMASRIGEV
ncbi:amino acid adenylation domain-containing protein [Paenibacillus polymyxa]|uniref:amino acid adenylation domain-containing protein n=1 Tax=Paenibacillus polymyxa TaxID=1406 RepID=UPI002AB40394|nr:amino acid adenylation domain-containing protein [Paenibacillus polymyxa]MDY8047365.1 amino acid adenylation domain-containing protein [Paenibacillus polymyxa]